MAQLSRRDLELLKEKLSGDELADAIKRVEGGEPLAYAIGEWYFYGLTFKLNRDCLIPRPDTEHVVDQAITLIPKNSHFIDLCTGSGCIAISILSSRPDLTATALDISSSALEMARENAVNNGVSDRLTLVCADVFETDPSQMPSFCAVVSNPPYIRSEVVPTLEVSASEPLTALDGGADGLDFYRRILEAFSSSPIIIFEIGYDQGKDLTELLSDAGYEPSIIKDYGKNDRVALGIKKQKV